MFGARDIFVDRFVIVNFTQAFKSPKLFCFLTINLLIIILKRKIFKRKKQSLKCLIEILRLIVIFDKSC